MLLFWCCDRGYSDSHASPADVVVYDYENLTMGPMEIAPDFPGGEWRRVRKTDGYRYILVNGELTLENGKETGKPSGHLLRHGAAM